MTLRLEGRAWVFGDDVLNDGGIMTIEQVHRKEMTPSVLARYCMIGIDPAFPDKVSAGDIVFAGKNFGRGQLHVQGPLSIKGLGVGLVTESMSRGFFRLSVAAGTPMLPFADGVRSIVQQGDAVRVDFETGVVENVSRGLRMQAPPMPAFLLDFIRAGGEFAWLAATYGGR